MLSGKFPTQSLRSSIPGALEKGSVKSSGASGHKGSTSLCGLSWTIVAGNLAIAKEERERQVAKTTQQIKKSHYFSKTPG
jgi:hypothetical protein